MRMPTAGTPYRLSDIIAAKFGLFKSKNSIVEFESILAGYLNIQNVKLVNSGTTACYLLLRYLKSIRKDSKQTEIIITNYTAPSLLLPIQKAGLKCVVVDTDNFNMDFSKIESIISENTLAIMPIHMFGIPTAINPIKNLIKDRNIFILEDAASSLGSKIKDQHTGAIADFGFYSLNRGKNISTLSGGIIVWKDDEHCTGIEKLTSELPRLSKTAQFKMLFKFFALTLAVRPLFYTILNFFISKFKYTTLHTDFNSFEYSTFQAEIGKNLWKREEKLTKTRIKNGKLLMKIFDNVNGCQAPKYDENMTIAYNQFPILIDDPDKMKYFETELLKNGIETSRLYGKTLHQLFPEKIGNASNTLKNSEYLAKHLLLIPPHAQITQKYLNIIEAVVNKIFK